MGLLEVWAPLGCAMVPYLSPCQRDKDGKRGSAATSILLARCPLVPHRASAAISVVPGAQGRVSTSIRAAHVRQPHGSYERRAPVGDGSRSCGWHCNRISRNVKLSGQRLFA